ncbi:MAG: ribbon-helix-helix domain-containing protein [Myxococcales bacterium]|nr:ribbon-helix-helix domain-containing protein [Myxococcales bacterium]
MHDTTMDQAVETSDPHHTTTPHTDAEKEVVSTHVLVEQDKVEQLRDLSKRTRIAQSEYLREAVDDLLNKYHKLPEEP